MRFSAESFTRPPRFRTLAAALVVTLLPCHWAWPATESEAKSADAETARRQVEIITNSRHHYAISMGGTVDGTRTRDPIGTRPWGQSLQTMRFVRLENVGDTDVVNPWVLVNGRRDWRTAQDIVDEALRAYGDPAALTEREKAEALYEFQRRHRFHASSGDLEVRDPVKMFNVYGYTLCGDNAPVLMDLWRLAGLKVRRGFLTGHCVGEVWYEGAWHMLDGDGNVFYLARDNQTIAGESEAVRDHDLIKRTHAYGGINTPDGRRAAESTAALYTFEGRRRGEYPSHLEHSMDLTLRPGEALEWRWSHSGKHHYSNRDVWIYGKGPLDLQSGWGEKAFNTLRNGLWIYEPPLREAAGRRGASVSNIRWSSQGSLPAASAEVPSDAAALTWQVSTPYPIVGGRLSAQVRRGDPADCRFSLSTDGRTFRPVEETAASPGEVAADLDSHFPNEGKAFYTYWLRLDLAAGRPEPAGLDTLRIENDLQMAALSLPELELGENRISYQDENPGPRQVRLTFDWVETSFTHPPAAPQKPLFPPEDGEVEGTQLTFRWDPASDPDGDAIGDYHFQLSAEPSMRRPLSSNFDKLVSHIEPIRSQPSSSEAGEASHFGVPDPSAPASPEPAYALPYAGLLNPGQRYYWRVRARDAQGVWGDWSRTWSFVPSGPGVPLQVRLESEDGEDIRLRWQANPQGRAPVSYEIYASNEKGFSISDTPYDVYVGSQAPAASRVTFPANRLTATESDSLSLVPSFAYYRVVAVDSQGVRSGPSDYAAAPRPFIHTQPVVEARVGREYRYQASSIFSLGDLRCRVPEQDSFHDTYCRYAFWDREQPSFKLVEESPICGWRDPSWLRLDPANGVLSGTPGPEDVDEYQINLVVEIEGKGQEVQSFVLKVVP